MGDSTIDGPAPFSAPTVQMSSWDDEEMDGANRAASASRKSIQYDPNSYYYDMSNEKKMLIFNHNTFTPPDNWTLQLEPRVGTDKDKARLQHVFGNLGFNITVYEDKTEIEIRDIFLGMPQENFSRTSCLCFVFLTHGTNDLLYASNQATYSINQVTKILEDIPELNHIPKLFFIQVCRGKMLDKGVRLETDSVDGCSRKVLLRPTQADFFFLRSSVEDYVSFKNEHGSWMINELCNVVEELGGQLDLTQISTLVHQRVAIKTSQSRVNPDYCDKKQMPETKFTLTKLLKFG